MINANVSDHNVLNNETSTAEFQSQLFQECLKAFAEKCYQPYKLSNDGTTLESP